MARVEKEKIEDVSKMTVSQCRSAYKKLANEYAKLKEGAYCHECGIFKPRDKFYKSVKTASGLIPVCKECLYRIGTGYDDKTKETHETRETVIEAMKKADLPFIEDLYETSCNAVTNEASGKKRGTGYSTMITCLQSLPQYFGMSFKDSDVTVFGNTIDKSEQLVEIQKENNNIVREKNEEILEQYKMNRRDTIHAIGYDPFENYPVEEDKPILYAQLNSFIDDETKKRRSDGTFQNVNNSYGRYADRDKVISSALEYIGTIECEDINSKIDRRAIKLRYNAFCNGAKKYKNNPDLVESLIKECIEYNKSLEFKPIEGGYDGEFKQGEPLDMSVFPNISIKETDDIWGEPIDDDGWDLY